ncbi:MAG TPA: hypothetical protein VKR59_19310 [Terriglobales bacterium]|nr:hypothetical protein [Terriglobales bacterium]
MLRFITVDVADISEYFRILSLNADCASIWLFCQPFVCSVSPLYLPPSAEVRKGYFLPSQPSAEQNQNQRVSASGEHLKHLLSKSSLAGVKVNKIVEAQPQWMGPNSRNLNLVVTRR